MEQPQRIEISGNVPAYGFCLLAYRYKSEVKIPSLLQVEQCFHDIDNILIKSLQSVQKVMINDKHCFEIYGYDILLDSDLKP
jgi:hypothetical protein